MVSFPGMPPELVERSPFDIILVIEDDEDTREMLTVCIESETTCRVMALSGAEEVLKCLQEIKEAKPRLFIIDFHLLTLTGLELYDSLHALREFAHVPAIIITATTLNLELERGVVERNLKLLIKTFDIDELIGSIERMLIDPGQLI